ncbi:hypothetical protein GKE82_24665 [Conexibacter sp. W3-3-2]|uniref:hypothetical protein n=1 Tax=Conexibacter sp. W3-3-2 TaxID=2675227 RepID=UPI0012B723EE|nr:hypothetical protein [Conexibacter sp. W3-3-2]MTD47134.1 hypothetical protein [Conexibacter sp. W3-3-2]MTD47401.1 hypothetical protein [Conexibacter sp. W3-3-2]
MTVRPAHLALAGLLAAAALILALALIGGEDQPATAKGPERGTLSQLEQVSLLQAEDRDAVRATLTRFAQSFSDGYVEDACALTTAQLRTELRDAVPGAEAASCGDILLAIRDGLSARERASREQLEVSDVRFYGVRRRARAEVTDPIAGRQTVALRYEQQQWRMDATNGPAGSALLTP